MTCVLQFGDGRAGDPKGGVGHNMSAGDEGVDELHDDVLELESRTWNMGTEQAWRMRAFSVAGRDMVWLTPLRITLGEPAITEYSALARIVQVTLSS